MTKLGFKHTVSKILFWVLVFPLIAIGFGIADKISPLFSADWAMVQLVAEFCAAGVAFGIAAAVDAALNRREERFHKKHIVNDAE